MAEDRVERTVHIAAPAERVWDILTKPEHIGHWFGTGTPATVDLQPGGRFVFAGHGERECAN